MMGDFYHMFFEETSDLGAFISGGQYVHHVHLASRIRVLPGQDDRSFVSGFAGLQQIGYTDYCSFECGCDGDRDADRAGGQLGLENVEQRVPPEHEADDALDAGLGHRAAQPPVLVHRQHHRLLDQDVLAGLGGGNALLGVDVVRAADVDDERAPGEGGRDRRERRLDAPTGQGAEDAADDDVERSHVARYPLCGWG